MRPAAWQDFDTTPPSWVTAEASRASPMQFLSDCWSRLVFEFAKFRWGQTHLRQYFLWGAGARPGALALPDYLSQPAAAAPPSREEPGANPLAWDWTRNSIKSKRDSPNGARRANHANRFPPGSCAWPPTPP
jgi:hypothetical protein